MDFVDRKLEKSGYKVYRQNDDSVIYILKCKKRYLSDITSYVIQIDFNDEWRSRCYITSWGNVEDPESGISDMKPVGIGLHEYKLLYFKAQKMRFKRWIKRIKNRVASSMFKKDSGNKELVNDHKSYEAKQKEIKHVSYTEKEN